MKYSVCSFLHCTQHSLLVKKKTLLFNTENYTQDSVKAKVAIVAFSVSSRRSFDSVQQCIDAVRREREDMVFIAAGNTGANREKRVVSEEEARAFFQSMDPPIFYFETSTKNGRNIKAIFENGIRVLKGNSPVLNENSLTEEYGNRCIVS